MALDVDHENGLRPARYILDGVIARNAANHGDRERQRRAPPNILHIIPDAALEYNTAANGAMAGHAR